MGTHPKNFSYKLFATSTGGVDLNLDASTGDILFDVGTSDGTLNVARINFSIVDGGMKYGEFAGLGSVLGTGITIKAHDENDAVVLDFLDGKTITANEDFALIAGVDNIVEPAAGDDFLAIRWTIRKAGDLLTLNAGDYIRITLQDDLSGISYFRAMLQGLYRAA